jgi:hypothetical protein
MPEMTPVNSSLIKAIGYNDEKEELHVEFKNGTEYVYQEVPRGAFDQFLEAKSQGSFFLKKIKPVFSCVKVKS